MHKNTAFLKNDFYRKIIDYIVIFVGHHTIAVLSAKASEKLIFFIKISTVFGKKFLVCSEQTIAFVLLSYLLTPGSHCAHPDGDQMLMLGGTSSTTEVYALFERENKAERCPQGPTHGIFSNPLGSYHKGLYFSSSVR